MRSAKQFIGQTCIAIACAALLLSSVRADTLRMHDGTTYQGKLIDQNDRLVTFEVVSEFGSKKRRMFLATKVADVQLKKLSQPSTGSKGSTPKPKSAGTPGYYMIPIKGRFGLEIKASVIAKCLDHARKIKPDVIVLHINSGGGEVRQMLAIMEMLTHWQANESTPIVAFIEKQAFSAAALTALSAKQIYMAPGSAMGAALIIRVGDGKVTSLDSTREGARYSAMIRSKARIAAAAAGHHPLIADAMIHPELELSYTRNKSGRALIEPGSPAGRDGFMRLIEKDKLLSLTPSEAIDINIVEGTVANIDALGVALGKSGWKPASRFGELTVRKHERSIAKSVADYTKAVKNIRINMNKFRRAGKDELYAMERSIVSTRLSLIRLQRLSKEQDHVAVLTRRDFPDGLDKWIESCNNVLRKIKDYRRSK